jgi:hypothetical protein
VAHDLDNNAPVRLNKNQGTHRRRTGPSGGQSRPSFGRVMKSTVVSFKVFFSAEISDISAKTGFTGYHREKGIPNEIFRYLNNLVNFKFLYKF